MPRTIYASFSDAALAEKAAGALLDYGARSEDLSLLAGQDYGRTRNLETAPTVPLSGTKGGLSARDTAPATQDAESERILGYDSRNAADNPPVDSGARSDTEAAAKKGLSTTTPGDALAEGGKGAAAGLAVGIAADIASLLIPGFGWVVGGGALATAIAAAAGTTAAGAVAGGALGYLKDQGVSDTVVQDYESAIKHGGAVLALQIPSGRLLDSEIEPLLAKYGASNFQYA